MTLLSDEQVGLAPSRLLSDEQVGLGGPSTLSDVAQSIPQYAETAVSHTLGLPGDIARVIGKGAEYFGATIDPNAEVYGSPEIQGKLDEWFGKQYQPQTQVGKGLDVAASFVPAMIGGPEALLTKAATRVAAPAAAVQGIENLPVSEGAKTGLETAAILLSPFAANKVISGTLNQIRRSAPLHIGNELGVLPTTAQLGKTKVELERIISAPQTTPRMARQANEALAEITNRYEGMKIIEKYTGGAKAGFGNAEKYRKGLTKLQADVENGKVQDVFTPGQKAQMAKVVEGGALMRAAQVASKIGPLHSMSHLSGYGVMGLLLSKATEGTPMHSLLIAGVPQAIAMAAKVAYPHFTKNQINKLVELVQKGRKVPGAPARFAPRPDLTTSPLQIPLAAQRYSNLQGD